MTNGPFHIVEPATGDEVRVEKTRQGVMLRIRSEVGSWQTVELRPGTVESLVARLDEATAITEPHSA
jgi:hypothetical protein